MHRTDYYIVPGFTMAFVLGLTYFFWNFGFMFVPNDTLFMKPNIAQGEIVFVSYDGSSLPNDRSKAVLYKCPVNGELAVGRVIAVAGQTIEIKDRKVFINDALIKEPYARRENTNPDISKMLIPQRAIYVLADDRMAKGASYYDSRYVGPIPIECIIGVTSVPLDKK